MKTLVNLRYLIAGKYQQSMKCQSPKESVDLSCSSYFVNLPLTLELNLEPLICFEQPAFPASHLLGPIVIYPL